MTPIRVAAQRESMHVRYADTRLLIRARHNPKIFHIDKVAFRACQLTAA
jgi:hypothetical protein